MPSSKAQLGARVTDPCKRQAVGNAAAKGLSLNAYIEQLIWADERAPTLLDPPLEGQIDLVEAIEQEATGVSDAVDWKRFDQRCSMGAYHWRCGPGNPCRRCGGEI